MGGALMLGPVLLFLHIAAMFAAVTLLFGFGVIFGLAQRSGQTAVVRSVVLAGRPAAALGPPLFMTGGILGLLTAIAFGFDLVAPWLVIAYALFAATFVTAIVAHRPFEARLRAVLPTAPDGPITGPLAEALADPRERAANLIDTALLAALIFDMVVKPFS